MPWLWNEAVHQQQARRKPTLCKLSKLLTAARAANPWLRRPRGEQVAQQQALRNYALALDHSFKVKGRGARLGLAERTFLCTACGYTADRGRNAARVILAVAERGHTSTEDVSHCRPPLTGRPSARSELEIPRLWPWGAVKSPVCDGGGS